MLFHLVYLICFFSYLKQVLTVSVYINTTSQFAFSDRIMKAEVTILNGT